MGLPRLLPRQLPLKAVLGELAPDQSKSTDTKHRRTLRRVHLKNKDTDTKMTPSIKLNSGYDMPQVGFGLWKVENATCADTVYNAIKAGYRLLDGACGKSPTSLPRHPRQPHCIAQWDRFGTEVKRDGRGDCVSSWELREQKRVAQFTPPPPAPPRP